MKLKYQPSIYIERRPGESAQELTARVLADSRLLPDQRESLRQDRNAAFEDCVKGIWLEQAPVQVPA